MKQYLYVIADTNDADYVSRKEEISEEDLNTLKPLIEAIKNFTPYKTKSYSGMEWTHSHNYPSGDLVRDDLGELSARDYYISKGIAEDVIDLFEEEFTPYAEYGIHTIESIDLLIIAEEIKLL